MTQVLFSKIKYLLEAIGRESSRFDFFLNSNAYIGYSSADERLARYLQLALELSGLQAHIYGKEFCYPTFSQPESLDFYFAIIPPEFNTLQKGDYQIEEEIRGVITRQPLCKIVFVYTRLNDIVYTERLRSSIERITGKSVFQIDCTALLKDFYRSAKLIGDTLMEKKIKASDTVREIMTLAEDLATVTTRSRFSELYYFMYTLGVSHCPVLDDDTEECLRIVSRRDLVDKIPPGGALILPDVAARYGLDLSRVAQETTKLGRKLICDEKVFPNPQKPLIQITSDNSIDKVIEKLLTQYPVGEKLIRVSGLPVIDEGKLEGFVSYKDVLRKFIKGQSEFLQKTTVGDVATIPQDYDNVVRLTDSDTLSDALQQLGNGSRSLPVVKGDYESHILCGFVDDIKVRTYNHPMFAKQLIKLSVVQFMAPVERLPIITPSDTLQTCIENFLKPFDGSFAPASFVVSELIKQEDGSQHQELKGVLSYIDILKGWKEWKRKNQSKA